MRRQVNPRDPTDPEYVALRTAFWRGRNLLSGSRRRFHARFGEFEAQVAIANGELLNGEIPRRAHALVRDWIDLHKDELYEDWDRARSDLPLVTIAPLP